MGIRCYRILAYDTVWALTIVAERLKTGVTDIKLNLIGFSQSSKKRFDIL